MKTVGIISLFAVAPALGFIHDNTEIGGVRQLESDSNLRKSSVRVKGGDNRLLTVPNPGTYNGHTYGGGSYGGGSYGGGSYGGGSYGDKKSYSKVTTSKSSTSKASTSKGSKASKTSSSKTSVSKASKGGSKGSKSSGSKAAPTAYYPTNYYPTVPQMPSNGMPHMAPYGKPSYYYPATPTIPMPSSPTMPVSMPTIPMPSSPTMPVSFPTAPSVPTMPGPLPPLLPPPTFPVFQPAGPTPPSFTETPTPGKGKGAPSYCEGFPIIFNNDEVKAHEFNNSIGFGLNEVPFYDANTGLQLGTYSDFATNTGPNECVVNGAFSFDFDNSTELFRSQINTAFTCGSEMNTITGGSGRFGCASGYEVFQYQDAEILGTAIFLCTPLCPFRFKLANGTVLD